MVFTTDAQQIALDLTAQGPRTKPCLVAMPHLLEGGGAPRVFRELIEDIHKTEPGIPITVVGPPVRDEIVSEYEALGVDLILCTKPRCQFRFTQGDVLLINSRGHSFVDFEYLLNGSGLLHRPRHDRLAQVDRGPQDGGCGSRHSSRPQLQGSSTN